jgi:chromosome segregation ATPase
MNVLLTIVVALLGTKAFWDLLTAIVNRKGIKAEAAQIEAKIEIDQENAKADRVNAEINQRRILAEDQVKSQQVALDSWRESFNRVRTDLQDVNDRYGKCREELREIHDTFGDVLDVFSEFLARARENADSTSNIIVMKVTGPEFLTLRDTVSNARIRLK